MTGSRGDRAIALPPNETTGCVFSESDQRVAESAAGRRAERCKALHKIVTLVRN